MGYMIRVTDDQEDAVELLKLLVSKRYGSWRGHLGREAGRAIRTWALAGLKADADVQAARQAADESYDTDERGLSTPVVEHRGSAPNEATHVVARARDEPYPGVSEVA